MNYIFVGCDSHDKTLVNKIARNREAAERKSFAATRAGRRKMIEYLKTRSQAAGNVKVVVAYEASGNGFILCDEMKAAGFECHVLAPTKIERSSKQKRNKNDDRDADRLLEILRGHYLAGNKIPSVWVPDLQTRDDREPVRGRHDLSHKQTAVKTQIQMLLKRHGVEKPEGLGSSWSKPYRQWLKTMTEDAHCGWGVQKALGSLLRQLEFLENEIKQLGRGDGGIGRHATMEADCRGHEKRKRRGPDDGVEIFNRHRRLLALSSRTASGSLLRLNAVEP